MKNIKSILQTSGWLVMGLVLLFLSGGDQPVGIAVWLAPMFILRFFRETGILKAIIMALPGMVVVELIADRGMTPFPSFKILLFYTTLGIAFGLLPYILDRLLNRSLPRGLRTFLFPSLAVAIPFILGSHGTWGAKANGLADLALLQWISVTGVAGIAFLIYWTAAVANEIWERRGDHKIVFRWSAILLIALMVVYGFGLIRLGVGYHPQKSVRAAGIVHDPGQRAQLMAAFTTLVRSGAEKTEETEAVRTSMKSLFHALLTDSISLARSGVEIAVWCEGAVVLFEEDEPDLIRKAAEKAREHGFYLGLSAAVYQNLSRSDQPGIQPLFKNKLILLSPRGEVVWEYAKGILVPGMEAAVTIPGDRIMRIGGSDVKITGAICYELDFPRHVRQAVKIGSDLILGPSNDWEAIKDTHARMARLRAIETGISLLRPANGGVSTATDPYGRILARVDNYHCPGAPLVAAIPVDPVSTVYSAWGDYFSWICLILALACLTLGFVLSVQQKFFEKKTPVR